MKRHFNPAKSLLMFVWMFILCQTNLAHAGWDAGSITIPAYSDSPQRACEYLGIERSGSVLPYRIAWLLPQGAQESFYRSGFDVQGPSIPNPENNYTPSIPNSGMFCILFEQYAFPLTYRPDPQSLRMSISGPTETKPRSTANWRELMMTASVKQGAQPIAGKAVTFKIVPKQGGDGHVHALTGKTAGTIANGTTNAAGELKSPYFPSEFAGVYTIEASCADCSNKATVDVTVRVPELVSLPPDTSATPRYKLVGSTTTHPDSHNLSKAAGVALENLFAVFETAGWGEIGVNDASLPWGGRFDVGAHWTGSHYEHREGDEVDISFRNPIPIGSPLRNKVYVELAKAKRFTTSQVLWHQFDNPSVPSYAHFHVYLLGQNMSQQIPN